MESLSIYPNFFTKIQTLTFFLYQKSLCVQERNGFLIIDQSEYRFNSKNTVSSFSTKITYKCFVMKSYNNLKASLLPSVRKATSPTCALRKECCPQGHQRHQRRRQRYPCRPVQRLGAQSAASPYNNLRAILPSVRRALARHMRPQAPFPTCALPEECGPQGHPRLAPRRQA